MKTKMKTASRNTAPSVYSKRLVARPWEATKVTANMRAPTMIRRGSGTSASRGPAPLPDAHDAVRQAHPARLFGLLFSLRPRGEVAVPDDERDGLAGLRGHTHLMASPAHTLGELNGAVQRQRVTDPHRQRLTAPENHPFRKALLSQRRHDLLGIAGGWHTLDHHGVQRAARLLAEADRLLTGLDQLALDALGFAGRREGPEFHRKALSGRSRLGRARRGWSWRSWTGRRWGGLESGPRHGRRRGRPGGRGSARGRRRIGCRRRRGGRGGSGRGRALRGCRRRRRRLGDRGHRGRRVG